jgi:hypothetical protein
MNILNGKGNILTKVYNCQYIKQGLSKIFTYSFGNRIDGFINCLIICVMDLLAYELKTK